MCHNYSLFVKKCFKNNIKKISEDCFVIMNVIITEKIMDEHYCTTIWLWESISYYGVKYINYLQFWRLLTLWLFLPRAFKNQYIITEVLRVLLTRWNFCNVIGLFQPFVKGLPQSLLNLRVPQLLGNEQLGFVWYGLVDMTDCQHQWVNGLKFIILLWGLCQPKLKGLQVPMIPRTTERNGFDNLWNFILKYNKHFLK